MCCLLLGFRTGTYLRRAKADIFTAVAVIWQNSYTVIIETTGKGHKGQISDKKCENSTVAKWSVNREHFFHGNMKNRHLRTWEEVFKMKAYYGAGKDRIF